MKISEYLKAAKAKISNPARWVTRHAAVDVNGLNVDASSDRACKWCALGACLAVSPNLTTSVTLFNRLQALVPDGSVSSFNDSVSHADVMFLFDRAIADQEALEADEAAP